MSAPGVSGFAVKTFPSAAEFLAQPELDVPGCVLADLQMPGLSGLDLQDALAKAGHTLPVIFLSGHGDVTTTVRAMRRGAEDFLTKRAPKSSSDWWAIPPPPGNMKEPVWD